MTKEPRVTVILSVYNGGHTIADAIDSILLQSFSEFDFLIINDGCTDNTAEILASFADPRIRLIDNGCNLGLSASLNRGIAEARGAYIVRMDADDIALPDRLARQFEFMEAHPDVDVCGGWYARFGSRTEVAKKPVCDRDIKDTLFFYNCIAHPSVMLRTRTFQENRLRYSENFRYAQDYELWCREIGRLKFFNIPEIIIQYRTHESQASSKGTTRQDAAADMVRKSNLQRVGVRLSEEESRLFCDITRKRSFDGQEENIIEALQLLDRIGTHGARSHGAVFSDIIRRYMRSCAEAGLQAKKTSLPVFRSIVLKWNVYPEYRHKLRYVYHALKNRVLAAGT